MICVVARHFSLSSQTQTRMKGKVVLSYPVTMAKGASAKLHKALLDSVKSGMFMKPLRKDQFDDLRRANRKLKIVSKPLGLSAFDPSKGVQPSNSWLATQFCDCGNQACDNYTASYGNQEYPSYKWKKGDKFLPISCQTGSNPPTAYDANILWSKGSFESVGQWHECGDGSMTKAVCEKRYHS